MGYHIGSTFQMQRRTAITHLAILKILLYMITNFGRKPCQ